MCDITVTEIFSDFFKKDGTLRRISKLKPWPLKNVLVEKYEWDEMAAEGFSQFLLPMLHPDPARRATAAQCLKHPWITNTDFITRVSSNNFLRISHFTFF